MRTMVGPQPSLAPSQDALADVLVVTALRMERDAVKAVTSGALGEWTETRAPSTNLRIERRSFRAAGGSELRVALICAEEMGTAQTVGVAGPVVMALRPRCLAMCGVLAGEPKDTEFGDVVIADQLLMHDTGKRTEKGFKHETRPHKLDIRWLEKVRDFAEKPGDALAWLAGPPWTLAQQRAWLLDQFSRGFKPPDHKPLVDECCPSYREIVAELRNEGLVQPKIDEPLTDKGKAHVEEERFLDPRWPGLDPPRRSTKVHVAPIAAGNAVQADPALWDELSTFARKALGVEMESYGVGTAAELHQVELTLVMKGVMDRADKHKDDRFKPFAARASAECLLAFLRANLPPPPSTDLARVLDPGISSPPKHNNPGALLHARHAIVPFYKSGRAAMLADIAAWCSASKPMVSARLIVGAGGMGKTRLLMEATERLREQDWLAGFFRRDADPAGFLALLDASRPALIVIDYAESRTGLLMLLRWVAERRDTRKAPLRVMLLARAIGDWWADVCGRDEDVGGMLRENEVLEVAPLAQDAASRAEVFWQAARAFAKHLKKDLPRDAPSLGGGVFERALYLHMAALMAVEGRDTAPDKLLENVLDHEERFWLPESSSHARGPLGDGTHAQRAELDDVRRTVTALTLRGGAGGREETNALVARVGAGRNDGRTLMLHDLYPGEKSTIAMGLYVTGLEPDLLGEAMALRTLVRERSDAPRYLERVLEEAGEKQVETAFEVLGRISSEYPEEARPWIRDVLARDLPRRATPALEAAKSIGRKTAHAVVGKELALALEREGSAELAVAIERAVPIETVSLCEVHAWALQKRLAMLPKGEDEEVVQERARLLNNLGYAQSELGQREAALAPIQEAVEIYRKLAAARPDAFLPDLAISLNNLGNRQSELGQREAAVASTQEALKTFRKLAAARPDAFLPSLATSLNSLGNVQSRLGQREAAVASTQEAVETYRKLAEAHPDAFLPDLAGSLITLGAAQRGLGQREAAVASTQEAVETYRKLAETHPDAFLPRFATSVGNLGALQGELEQREAAVALTQEAVETYRKLAEAHPDAFLPDLAKWLNNLSAAQGGLGQREAALASARDAVDIRRELAEAHPAAFLPDLAMSLNNLGAALSGLGQREAALVPTQEAVETYRKLAEAHPDAFLHHLATSLSNLGIRQGELGHREAALASVREAVDIYRKLVAARRDAFLPDLASSLSNLGARQGELGHREAALASAREAVDIYRKLVAARRGAFLPDLASSLNNLGNAQAGLGHREAAFASTQEAVETYRELAAAHSDAFLPSLANGLNNLGATQHDLGQKEAAVASTQEAVEIYRKLAAANADAFLSDLAASIGNLGAMQHGLGQKEAALVSAQEAVDTYRKLAAANADAFLPHLARCLNNLGNAQSVQGQKEAALVSAQEAVDTYRKLVAAHYDVFLSDLAASLINLGVWQSTLGQREAALASTQEAVDAFRQLAAACPAVFLPNLAGGLHNLGMRQNVLGEREAALVSIQEAVEIRRKLAEVRPAVFLPDLAASLHNLGAMQNALGQKDATLGSIQEAVDIRRKLAEAQPAVFLRDLATSLDNLAATQNALGQKDAALVSIQEAVDIRRKLV